MWKVHLLYSNKTLLLIVTISIYVVEITAMDETNPWGLDSKSLRGFRKANQLHCGNSNDAISMKQ